VRIFSDKVLREAAEIIAASKSLDYTGIVNNNEKAISQLKEVLQSLNVASSSVGMIERAAPDQDPTSRTAIGKPVEQAAAQTAVSAEDDESRAKARRVNIVTTMKAEGFDDRLGKLYNSFSRNRSIPFTDAPHRRGLPLFDMVVAPDFSPCAGMHGIFVAGSEVMSIVLALDADNKDDWSVIKRKNFSTVEEMADAVIMLSAGFG
jgi:hypothetical protein